MPAAPEFADRLPDVRPAEILGQAHAEHSSDPDPHVGIPGERVIHLQRQADQPQPRHERAQLACSQREDRVGLPAGNRGHDEDFPNANEKPPHPIRVIAQAWPTLREVRCHAFIGDRTTGDHGQEQQMHRELASAAIRGGAAAVHVDNVRDAMKGEVRDTERNDRHADAPQRTDDQIRTQDRRDHRDVHGHCHDEPRPAAQPTARRRDPLDRPTARSRTRSRA